ncbi:hypothetical protein ACIBCT_12730 [Streptosporangium sp. NPDC050855]|uniref:hypothetical protein n=1 Tax=Streptosporangium sp. NPDC050855 TaxID=3366194 RepID=UPI0037B37166
MTPPISLTRASVLAVLALAAAACSGPSPRGTASPPVPAPESAPESVSASASPSPVALRPSPLRLPAVRAGAACPTTPRRPWSGPGEAAGVLGDGPLYPIADYFMKGTVLELRPGDRDPEGSYVKKVRWLASGYAGPVLIRADRIDGKGTASARFSYTGEVRDDGFHAEVTAPPNSMPGTTTIGGPGCYAYQIDGTTFSTVVVFRAVKSGAVQE